MVLVGAVRVVPSGKIYRQIFDDEVQEHQSLSQIYCFVPAVVNSVVRPEMNLNLLDF